MNNLEINKALAQAIGWECLFISGNGDLMVRTLDKSPWEWRVFDYRDWAVIGPIAERYNLFPWRAVRGWVSGLDYTFADTPLAVIKARK